MKILTILIFIFATAFYIFNRNKNILNVPKLLSPTSKNLVLSGGTTKEKIKEIVEKGSKYVLIDVRSKEEYETRHVPNAVSMPLDEIERCHKKVLKDLKCPIVVYCQSGYRSRKAAQKLCDLGYKNVLDLGSIDNWPYEF